jgi:hypothetical protein
MDMRTNSIGILFSSWVICIFAALPGSASGEGWTLDDTGSRWQQFAFGFASGIVGHEAGHILVATAKGYQVGYDGLAITYSGAKMSPASHLQLASAGFQTQWMLSELVLRDQNGREHKKPPSDFGAGVVSSYLGVSLAYLTFLKNQKDSDVKGISDATGLSRDRIAMMLAIPAVLDTWRLIGNDVPEWVPVVSVMCKGVGIAWIWTY